MKCLVTGASSGIGKDISIYLSNLGHEVIMVSSNKEKLENAKKDVEKSRIFLCDLKSNKNVEELLEFIRKEKPEIIVNAAGFGKFGYTLDINEEDETEMISVNVISLQKITRCALEYMSDLKESYILNIASVAGLMIGGPLMNTYYATKNYVRSYTLGLYEEMKKLNKNIHISCLCPGPVSTNFNNVANVVFSLKSLSSEYVSKFAIDKMFKKKILIIPGFSAKLSYFFGRILPTKLMLKNVYNTQKIKTKF